MSLDEEEDEPNRGARPSAQGEGAGAGPQGSGPATPGVIPVIVAADGSASIDGIPVPVMGGESVDVAILDTLHGYARNRDTTVTASISDPAAGYVAIVEVAPDGSSRLVEQHQNDTPEDAGTEQPTSPAADPVAPIFVIDSEDGPDPAAPPSPRSEQPLEQTDFTDDDDDDEDDDFNPGYNPDDNDDHVVAITPDSARPKISAASLTSRLPSLPALPSLPKPSIRSKASRQSDDEYEPPSFLKRPLGVGVAGVVVAAIVIVPLIVIGSSGGGSGSGPSQNQAADSSTTTTPTTPPTPLELTPSYSTSPSPSLSPSPSRSPSPSASKKAKAKAKPKPTPAKKATKKATVKPAPTKKAKPHKETAAEAVMKLQARDPGRHICYRVYLSKDGWQKPVCDGTTSGRVGTSQKIESINTATAGTKGTASSAWVHIDKWKEPWNGSADGVDNYIGRTKAGYPYILGFVINVGDGAVCQNAAVNGRWGGLACDEPKGQAAGNFIWGGTQDDSLWLQAVRFTV
ncbi:hypothetical protein [Streptomyces sp. NPDC050535]|uniref:hypothetical protein n=1 Tax=Streptomyces sp. NPDC050535 TaxID=3365626 RepID=UPI0037A391F1